MSYKALYLSIAGFTIRIDFKKSEYPFLKSKFQDDLKDVFGGFIKKNETKNADFLITVKEKQELLMINRKEVSCIEFVSKNLPFNTVEIPYSISVFQLGIVLREIVSYLLNKTRTGGLFHCSAVLKSGKAYVFTGPSGYGKSTISRMWGLKYQVLSDDLGILKKEKGSYYFYQSPGIEKNTSIIQKYRRYNLGSISFLKKSVHTRKLKVTDQVKIIQNITSQLISNSGYEFYSETKIMMEWLLEFLKKFKKFNYLYFSKNTKDLFSNNLLE